MFEYESFAEYINDFLRTKGFPTLRWKPRTRDGRDYYSGEIPADQITQLQFKELLEVAGRQITIVSARNGGSKTLQIEFQVLNTDTRHVLRIEKTAMGTQIINTFLADKFKNVDHNSLGITCDTNAYLHPTDRDNLVVEVKMGHKPNLTLEEWLWLRIVNHHVVLGSDGNDKYPMNHVRTVANEDGTKHAYFMTTIPISDIKAFQASMDPSDEHEGKTYLSYSVKGYVCYKDLSQYRVRFPKQQIMSMNERGLLRWCDYVLDIIEQKDLSRAQLVPLLNAIKGKLDSGVVEKSHATFKRLEAKFASIALTPLNQYDVAAAQNQYDVVSSADLLPPGYANGTLAQRQAKNLQVQQAQQAQLDQYDSPFVPFNGSAAPTNEYGAAPAVPNHYDAIDQPLETPPANQYDNIRRAPADQYDAVQMPAAGNRYAPAPLRAAARKAPADYLQAPPPAHMSTTQQPGFTTAARLGYGNLPPTQSSSATYTPLQAQQAAVAAQLRQSQSAQTSSTTARKTTSSAK
jgi:hypothetical protein